MRYAAADMNQFGGWHRLGSDGGSSRLRVPQPFSRDAQFFNAKVTTAFRTTIGGHANEAIPATGTVRPARSGYGTADLLPPNEQCGARTGRDQPEDDHH